MEQYQTPLDGIFLALSDPTRRAVIGRLGEGPASVTDLARPFDMALPSFMKHIRLLERTGLVRTHKSGRVRRCAIAPEAFAQAQDWLTAQKQLWESRTDRLETFLLTNDKDDER